MTFGQAFDCVSEGFKHWRSLEHNQRWWRMIDGTPIPNDLTVKIAEVVQHRVAEWTPTRDAYDAACKALTHWRAEAQRLGRIAGEKPREMEKGAPNV